MRHYNKITVIVGGLIEHDIESWSEYGHESVYSGFSPLFDGDFAGAHHAIKNEIARLEAIAKKRGMSFEVNGTY